MKGDAEIKEQVVATLGFAPPSPFSHGVRGSEAGEALKDATRRLIEQAVDLTLAQVASDKPADAVLRRVLTYVQSATGGTATARHMAAIEDLIEGAFVPNDHGSAHTHFVAPGDDQTAVTFGHFHRTDEYEHDHRTATVIPLSGGD